MRERLGGHLAISLLHTCGGVAVMGLRALHPRGRPSGNPFSVHINQQMQTEALKR